MRTSTAFSPVLWLAWFLAGALAVYAAVHAYRDYRQFAALPAAGSPAGAPAAQSEALYGWFGAAPPAAGAVASGVAGAPALKAIMASSNTGASYVIISTGSSEAAYRVGDRLPNGNTLKAITPRAITLSTPEGERELALP
jgi:hypothetical protein